MFNVARLRYQSESRKGDHLFTLFANSILRGFDDFQTDPLQTIQTLEGFFVTLKMQRLFLFEVEVRHLVGGAVTDSKKVYYFPSLFR